MTMDSAAVEIDGSVMEGVSTHTLFTGEITEKRLLFRAANMLTEG